MELNKDIFGDLELNETAPEAEVESPKKESTISFPEDITLDSHEFLLQHGLEQIIVAIPKTNKTLDSFINKYKDVLSLSGKVKPEMVNISCDGQVVSMNLKPSGGKTYIITFNHEVKGLCVNY